VDAPLSPPYADDAVTAVRETTVPAAVDRQRAQVRRSIDAAIRESEMQHFQQVQHAGDGRRGMENGSRDHHEQIEPGERVYSSDGRLLGRVTSLTEEGFEAEILDSEEDTEELPGQKFGEGYLMWRCEECGEMGELEDGMPESCPVCGAPEEAITAARED